MKDFGNQHPRASFVASSNEEGLALVGNRITGNRLDGLDEEVLSSISNEILRFREQKLL